MHQAVLDWVQSKLAKLPPRARVVELGSYDINGSVRPLFGDVAYVGVDVREGPGVDVVADAATFKPDQPPDTVISCEVLEHVAQAADVIANAYDMLAPGGLLLLTGAMNPRPPHSLVDGGAVRPGEYYKNADPGELLRWLEPFVDVEIEAHPDRGDLYAIAWKPKAAKKKAAKAPENKMLQVDEDKGDE